MKITVITAVLNDLDALVRTRQSVLDQTGVDIQHVVIDGGSSDGVAELLTQWSADSNLRFLSEPDSGVYDAFNKGLRLADGDSIGFLNAGDVYRDENVLSDVDSVLADPETDLVFGDIEITRPNSVSQVVRRYQSAGFTPQNLLRGFMPPHPSVYAKRQVYQEVGMFRDEFRIAGDFEWSIRTFLKHGVRAKHLDRTFVRMPAGGLSNNGLSSLWQNTVEMHSALEMNGLPASWIALAMRLPRKWLRA